MRVRVIYIATSLTDKQNVVLSAKSCLLFVWVLWRYGELVVWISEAYSSSQ